jgi:hypothetical protein
MAQLQAGQRQQIKGKNFAIPGKEKYPIHDVAHARNALVRVRQFGSPSEKSRVYSAVTKKYPALATRSSVVPQKLQRKAERKAGVGKGQESMKLEAPKQKLSSVVVRSFADEVGQIKQAVSAKWIYGGAQKAISAAEAQGKGRYAKQLVGDLIRGRKRVPEYYSGSLAKELGRGTVDKLVSQQRRRGVTETLRHLGRPLAERQKGMPGNRLFTITGQGKLRTGQVG